ncbi:MAG: hypothetical protein U0R68_13695 [Candidatus Nanopelagicales bacterium]
MSRRAAARSATLVAALALASAIAPSSFASPASVTTTTVARTVTAPVAVAAPRIRSLTVSVSKGVVTMPSRLAAGTYYIHVTTRDPDASLQVVRRPVGLSLATWRQRFLACNSVTPGEPSQGIVRRCRYWRTSATFVGGANVVRTSSSGTFSNPGGRATFALTLSPGQYWFYEDRAGQPIYGNTPLALSRIRTVTVVGTAERGSVRAVGVARFAAGSLTITRVIPRRGFLLGIGQPGIINSLGLARIKPGITDEQLVAFGVCFNSGSGIPELSCLDGGASLGGGVSGGASALWWYDLPPGEYIAFQAGTNEAGDAGLYPRPLIARLTVQP